MQTMKYAPMTDDIANGGQEEVNVTIRMPVCVKDALDRLAKKEGRTRSKQGARILSGYLEDVGELPATPPDESES